MNAFDEGKVKTRTKISTGMNLHYEGNFQPTKHCLLVPCMASVQSTSVIRALTLYTFLTSFSPEEFL